MNKFISLVILSIMTSNCSQVTNKSNLELINYIDSIKHEKIIYEFQVDSLERIIDTLSIEKNKVDKNNKIIFKETKTLKSNGYLKSINYYRGNNNLFYSKLESSNFGILSTSEFWENDDRIIKGLYLEYRDNKVKDTIDIHYEYFCNNNGLKNKTIISSKYKQVIGNTTELYYNDLEQPTDEIFIQYNDTLRVTKYIYSNDSLRKKIIKDYENSKFISFTYDKNENILTMEIFKEKNSLKKISKTDYKTDNNGDIIKSIKTKFPSNFKKYIIYVTEGK